MFYWFFAGMHTKITVKKEGKTNRLFYLVLLSAAFALVYCSALKIGFLGVRFFSENIYISWGGVIITATGVSFAIAARISLGENWSGRVTVKKGHELIQSGPYSITRHPIYTGMFF
jgi:protein-S-isoprenylcysteine O-methyltransferase Ste14